jgi:hypothetical protein
VASKNNGKTLVQTSRIDLEINEGEDLDDLGFEEMIGSNITFSTTLSDAQQAKPRKIIEIVKKFSTFRFADVTPRTDPIDFWLNIADDENSAFHPIASIALDIMCVPVTEVIADRLFSFLGFIYNDLISCLHENIVDDLLFCRWNQDFYE